MVSLLDLSIALNESEDISKFKSSSKVISELIKGNIMCALTKYAAYDFEVYMSTFFLSQYRIQTGLSKNCNEQFQLLRAIIYSDTPTRNT